MSYRQAKPIVEALSGRRSVPVWKHRVTAGRRSNHARESKFRKKVLQLVQAVKYGGAVGERFGPTLAAEHLASEDGLKTDAETLRRWMLAEGLWSRERRRRRHRRRRERKEHFGEMVQMDGSFHAWLEGRGARGLAGSTRSVNDDADEQDVGAKLGEQETIWAVADGAGAPGSSAG